MLVAAWVLLPEEEESWLATGLCFVLRRSTAGPAGARPCGGAWPPPRKTGRKASAFYRDVNRIQNVFGERHFYVLFLGSCSLGRTTTVCFAGRQLSEVPMLLLLLSERQPRLLPFSARLQWQLRKLISVGAFRFANTLYKSGNALSTPKLYPLD